MEELVRKEQELQADSPEAHPVIGISYVGSRTKIPAWVDKPRRGRRR